MRLRYFQSDNFGDALNPLVFEELAPKILRCRPDVDLVGIGSILGLDCSFSERQKVVFSSGFAYGKLPYLDNSYDIKALRGPLTAEKLGLNKDLAVVDGAALLSACKYPELQKIHNFSFMPHWESALKFDWRRICEPLGINYIDPNTKPDIVIDEIRSSNAVIAEAMHMAIVADALGVPWIAVKCYNGINEFKWHDWSLSLDIQYEPVRVGSLYENTEFNRELAARKLISAVPKPFYGFGMQVYEVVQNQFLIDKVIEEFRGITNLEPLLSKRQVLESKTSQLLSILDETIRQYC